MREKDRCKKCKGAKVVNEKKVMEIFIEKGMRNGEKIPMKGEADQLVRMGQTWIRFDRQAWISIFRSQWKPNPRIFPFFP